MKKLKAENILNDSGFHIGETVLENNQRTQEHTHDFYELFLVEEGEIEHFIDGDLKPMKKGELYFIKPENQHYFKKGNCRKAQFINLAFSEELFQATETIANTHLDIAGVSRVRAGVQGRMEIAVTSKMSLLLRERSGLFPFSQQGMVLSILLDCMIILASQPSGRGSAPEWLDHTCREMRKKENYLGGMKRFVDISGKSQEHLIRSMKRYYDITPSEYLNRIRLEHAAVLLETTDISILNIVFESGFNNVAYFNRIFKETYGITPRGYRSLNYSIINPV